jgi:hypothetical protein
MPPYAEGTVIKLNVAGWDRALRTVVGLGLVYFGFVATGATLAGVVLGVVGLVLVAVGLIGWCPIYAAFGFSTFHPRASHAERTS